MVWVPTLCGAVQNRLGVLRLGDTRDLGVQICLTAAAVGAI